MPNTGGRTRLAQKTKPRRFIPEVFFVDDLQCHRAVQIDVERLVGDAHRTPTQLDRFPVFVLDQFIVLKSLQRLFRYCRLDRFLGSRRLAGLNPASKSLVKHADRTKFHCSSKLVTATRAGALALRAHGPNHPSDAISASQSARLPTSIFAGSDTVRSTSSRNNAAYRFRNR